MDVEWAGAWGANGGVDSDDALQRAAALSPINHLTTQVTPTASFAADLGLDSLDAVELIMAVEEEFGLEIPDAEADKLLSTADTISFVASHPLAR